MPRALVALSALALPVAAAAQCRPPKNSNEAKLLAFYEAPIAFSMPGAPRPLPPGGMEVLGELVPVPLPGAAISRTGYCYVGKTESTRLAPLFARPRLLVGLPLGLTAEVSYVPPITVFDATPNLVSLAVARLVPLRSAPRRSMLALQLRVHGTAGSVRGPITCPTSALQVADSTAPCWGTVPSRDTFHPVMVGGEGALGLTTADGRWSFYAGGGVTWLAPRFQVGFTNADGATDSTRVEVNLVRGTIFGGASAYLGSRVQLSAQVYAVPTDVTTFRLSAGYRLR